MRLSHLAGKEVINLSDGSRLGTIDECELTFDGVSGLINAIILPAEHRFISLFSEQRSTTIPWQGIKRIGNEVIIVDLNNDYERYTKLYPRK